MTDVKTASGIHDAGLPSYCRKARATVVPLQQGMKRSVGQQTYLNSMYLSKPTVVARALVAQAREGAALPEEVVRLDRQMNSLRRGIGRLIDSFAEGIIDKAEFEPRIAGLKQRLSQLQCRHQAALEAVETERNLALVISHLEDFSAKVSKSLDHLDRFGMREIIRTVVRRIEIDDSQIDLVFRVPPSAAPPGPNHGSK